MMSQEAFRKVSWSDLESWVGRRSLEKGRTYKKRVSQLCLTAQGGLLAWVQGSQRYATQVSFEQGFVSNCSCPIGKNCKHTVAVVLHYLDLLKQAKDVPLAKEDDERFDKLERAYADNYRDQEAYEEENNMLEELGVTNNEPDPLQGFLAQQDKVNLERLLVGFSQQYPEVRKALEDQMQAGQGVSKELLRQIEHDVENLADVDLDDYYRRGYAAPSIDLGRLRFRLKLLLDAQHYDDLVALGHDILKRGKRLVEESHDEGELSEQIQRCMDIVLSALPHSSFSKGKQLSWLVEADLLNDYDFVYINNELESFWETPPETEDWAFLAEHLQVQLDKSSAGDFSANFRRNQLSNWLRIALENAGQKEKVLELLEQEAIKTQSYVRFVEELIARKMLPEAEAWIKQGIVASQKDAPGIASQLRDQWLTLRKQEGNVGQLAALSAETFFNAPSFHAFNNLKETALHAQLWQTIEPFARSYLEHGKRPKEKELGLPALDLPPQTEKRWENPPFITVLLELAMAEKKPDEVLHWHALLKKTRGGYSRYGYGNADDRVAEAVKLSHPEQAIQIWQSMAENLIAQTSVSNYQSAAEYLRKLKPIMAEAWQDYMIQLRDANKRKPRCVEILNGLLGKTILEG